MNRKETEQFLAEKGLSYHTWQGHEASQVFINASDAGSDSKSVVMARVQHDGGYPSYHWGYYSQPEANHVAKAVKRLRKVWVSDVVVFNHAVRF
jgi:hypothetical protein